MARFTHADTGVTISIADDKTPPLGYVPAPDRVEQTSTADQALAKQVQSVMPGAGRGRKANTA